MSVTAVIGAQWGDEGKGKIVDYLAQKAHIVARGNGGDNAGHTVINERGEFKLHLVPSGIFNPKIVCIIGNGVVVNPESLVTEMELLKKAGVGVSSANLKISARANLIMPWHILIDEAEEEFRGKRVIGTTRKGTGPAYADKAARKEIRAGDLLLLDRKDFKERLYLIWKEKSEILWKVYQKWGLGSFEQILNWLWYYKIILAPYITDTEKLIWKALDENKNILLEGAQGTGLDIDFGTPPHVTSSSCTAAGLCHGLGIPPSKIDEVIGVVKAYPTRVGSEDQPLPTEMPDDIANPLRDRAGEYGTTTNRPRRIGYFDALRVKYSARINGFTSLAITRLDSLTGVEELKICNAYRLKNGKIIYCIDFDKEEFSINELFEARPLYIETRGWKTFPENCKEFCDLPWQAQVYVRRIENLVDVPIGLISYGPARDQTIAKDH